MLTQQLAQKGLSGSHHCGLPSFYTPAGWSPFPHSPWIRKWEPPIRKAAPPLGEKPFREAFCGLRVLAQKMLKLLRRQGLFRLGKARKKSKTKQHRITYQERHRACRLLAIKWVTTEWENQASRSP